jgi:DNA-binding NtrC family response regulator
MEFMGPELTHVLIVDDEPAISKALATALTRAGGFRTSTALSGETAMHIVRSQHVDAMIVDLRIGDIRGDALFELVAATQPHLRKRTVFTTGDITERGEELVNATGCPMLRKPFELREVIDWARSVAPNAKDQSA